MLLVLIGYVALVGWLTAFCAWIELRSVQKRNTFLLSTLAFINDAWSQHVDFVKFVTVNRVAAGLDPSRPIVIPEPTETERVH